MRRNACFDSAVMDTTEAAKLKQLLIELNRICAEAEKIREEIVRVTHRTTVWPAGSTDAYQLSEPLAVVGVPTTLSSERHS